MCKAARILFERVCLAAVLALSVLFPKTLAFASDASSASLALPSVVAKAGDTVNLDLTIAGNPGIVGMTIEINYDSRLTLTSIENGAAFSALEMTRPGVLEPGCRLHWDAVELDESNIKDGVVATLTFTLPEDIPAGSSCFVRVVGVSENGQMDVYDTELRNVDLEAASGSISTEPEEQPQPVKVTGVTLDQSALSLTEEGQTKQLLAYVAPENAADSLVTWSSSDQAVASVSENGLVTAIASGQAVITVTTHDGGHTATCTVDVAIPEPVIPVTGIDLDQPTLNINALGEQVQLQATVEPPDASDPSVRWASTDPSVATVSEDGLVTACAEGVATIMVSTVDGGFMKACVVTVAIPLPVVSLDDASITITSDSCVYTGEALTPAVVVVFDGEELLEDIDYVLSYEDNTDVGEARVTVTGKGRYEGTAVVTFQITKAAQTITASNKSVQLKKTVSLGAKTSGKGKLTYKSAKSSIATVNSKGVVTGKKVGTVKITITAAATDNYAKATKTVTVKVGKANTLTAKAKKKSVTASFKTLKSKAVTLASNVTVSKAKGAVSYANASTNATAKKFKVNARTGKVTIPKGTKKGTYTVKVKVTAKGNGTYLAGKKTVTYKVVVK